MKKTLITLSSLLVLTTTTLAQFTFTKQNIGTAIGSVPQYFYFIDSTTFIVDMEGVTDPYYSITFDSGISWSPGVVNTNANEFLSNIFPINTDEMFATVVNPTTSTTALYHTTNGGSNWTNEPSLNQTGFYNFIHFFNTTDGVVIGDPTANVFQIYRKTAQNNWAVVASNNIPPALTGENALEGVFATLGNTLWFVTNKGRVIKTSNKGANWGLTGILPFVATNEVPSFIHFKDVMNGYIVFGTTGSAPVKRLYKTIDGGVNWTLVDLAGLGSDAILDIVFVPGTQNTFLASQKTTPPSSYTQKYSYDGGLTWQTMNTGIVKMFYWGIYNPRNIWIGGPVDSGGGGGIFKLTDTNNLITPTEGSRTDANAPSVSVFPNPTNGMVYLSCFGDETQDLTAIKVFDAVGREVYNFPAKRTGELFLHTINFDGLPKGFYLVELQRGNYHYTKKIINE
jgi:photosystem II stability/assembly factor-like uncharacterized protein